MVNNLPCNAKDPGSIPGLGTKITHAVKQLSPCTRTEIPVLQLRPEAAR